MSNEKPAEGAQPVTQNVVRIPPDRLFSLQRSRAIGTGLREIYDDIARQPPPESFLEILKEADEKAAAEGKHDALKDGGGAKIFVLGANVSAMSRK